MKQEEKKSVPGKLPPPDFLKKSNSTMENTTIKPMQKPLVQKKEEIITSSKVQEEKKQEELPPPQTKIVTQQSLPVDTQKTTPGKLQLPDFLKNAQNKPQQPLPQKAQPKPLQVKKEEAIVSSNKEQTETQVKQQE